MSAPPLLVLWGALAFAPPTEETSSPDAAGEAVEEAVESPADPNQLFLEAQELAAAGEVSKAIARLEGALGQLPESGENHQRRTLVILTLTQLYGRAYESDPASPEPLWRAREQLMGYVNVLAAIYGSSASSFGGHGEATRLIGEVEKKLEEGGHPLERPVEEREISEGEKALLHAREAVARQDWSDAIRDFEAAQLAGITGVAPELAAAHLKVAEQAFELEQYPPALEHYQRAAAMHPTPDAQRRIGECYAAMGKNRLAIEAYRTYLRTVATEAADRSEIAKRIDALESVDVAKAQVEIAKGRKLTIAGGVTLGLGVIALGPLTWGVLAGQQLSDDFVAEPSATTRDDLVQQGQVANGVFIGSAVVAGLAIPVGIGLLAGGQVRIARARGGEAQVALVPRVGADQAGIAVYGRF